MNTPKNKMIFNVSCIAAAVLIIGFLYFIFNDGIILGSNFTKPAHRISKQTMVIRKKIEVTYFSKDYVIVLSTPEGKDDQLYVNCFEKKLGGLYYKSTYSSYQGESKALAAMLCHFANNSKNDKFFIVSGYNKDFMAKSYSVQSSGSGNFITKDISKEKYFLDTYKKIIYPKIYFKDGSGGDITDAFLQ